MYDFEYLAANWARGDKAQGGVYPPPYRCGLGHLRGDEQSPEPYDVELYHAVDEVIQNLPYIQKRFFVIMRRERVVCVNDGHRVRSLHEVYSVIARECTPRVNPQFVEHYLKNGGEQKMKAAIVYAGQKRGRVCRVA